MNKTNGMTEEQKNLVKDVRKHLKVTKVVCTRSVKTKYGDVYVGFSAAWDSVQDDAGGSVDLMADTEGTAASGMTPKEAEIASLILGMQVAMAAYEQAFAGGGLTEAEFQGNIRAAKHNYSKLLTEFLNGSNGNGNGNG